ncbi:MAG: acyl-CoA dehydrogenase family protein, partial [Bacteroidia bacterium]|nr:acyl-CoA dehydrogenase family protein [Bacteroidia bacterium]
MQDHLLEEEHIMYRDAVRDFIKKEVVPHAEQWEKDGVVARNVWTKAGAQGMLCMDFPEEYGGLGLKDFRYQAIVNEEMCKAGASGPGFILQNDIMAPYFLSYFTEEQKER